MKLLDHLYLPLFYGKKTVQEYEMIRQKHTEEEMNAMMQEEWYKIISTLDEKGVQITKKNVTIKKNDENWVLNAHMQLEEAAVKAVPTSTEPVAEEEMQENESSAQEGTEETAE